MYINALKTRIKETRSLVACTQRFEPPDNPSLSDLGPWPRPVACHLAAGLAIALVLDRTAGHAEVYRTGHLRDTWTFLDTCKVGNYNACARVMLANTTKCPQVSKWP